ncbi:hypothetical protein SERLA73DRAFT_177971 [Serpula lacrymans var. lacrymans S7.3]|uniref:Uncharacterized protein n=2 Tax=Serpula lacrymans var. lacrymans TaxID=341189 RepID=F8PQ70_SERL3|nr:uncharacterized protein SERLADRAFT_461853 [Serpula lacrymans var. lacrymans S7.9]EGO02171.1 hypothetical protein SERLA73DRAFT_177971 [Serpula lacrymans var. lacrymans S7.3]EGO27794.1 hypothetical protein SERLADRAFT_461853 [Serpula lacrymans var. lacrymans S7.9]
MIWESWDHGSGFVVHPTHTYPSITFAFACDLSYRRHLNSAANVLKITGIIRHCV